MCVCDLLYSRDSSLIHSGLTNRLELNWMRKIIKTQPYTVSCVLSIWVLLLLCTLSCLNIQAIQYTQMQEKEIANARWKKPTNKQTLTPIQLCFVFNSISKKKTKNNTRRIKYARFSRNNRWFSNIQLFGFFPSSQPVKVEINAPFFLYVFVCILIPYNAS